MALCCVWLSAVWSCTFPTSESGVSCLRGGSREVRNISELVTKYVSTLCNTPKRRGARDSCPDTNNEALSHENYPLTKSYVPL